MSKTHMTPDGPKPCRASKRPCKYGEHFDSMEEAEKAFAEKNTPKTLKKDKYRDLDVHDVKSLQKHFSNTTAMAAGTYYSLGNWANVQESASREKLEKLVAEGLYKPEEIGLDRNPGSQYYNEALEDDEYFDDEDNEEDYFAEEEAPSAFAGLDEKQLSWDPNFDGFAGGIIRAEDLDEKQKKLLDAFDGFNQGPMFKAEKPFAVVEIPSNEIKASPETFLKGGKAELEYDSKLDVDGYPAEEVINDSSEGSYTIVAIGGLNGKGLTKLFTQES